MSVIDRLRLPKTPGTYEDRFHKLWHVDDTGKIWELVEIDSPSSRATIATQRAPFSLIHGLQADERQLLAELVAIHLDLIEQSDNTRPWWKDLRNKLLEGTGK